MSQSELSPLAADLQELLAAERAAHFSMPAGMQAKIAARLADSLALPLPPQDSGGVTEAASEEVATKAANSAGAASISPLASLAAKPMLVALTAFAIGAGAGIVGTLFFSNNAPVVVESAVVSAPVLDAGLVALVVTDAQSLVIASDDASVVATPVQRRPREGAGRGVERDTERDRALAAERALLELSRTAITRGDAQTALQELTRHKQDYRDGRLKEERDALMVQALVLAGSQERAEALAAAFKKRYPMSVFTPVMDHVLSESQ